MIQKSVAAIHDISCFGKCSLTVALPILSSAGIKTSVIPTAVLSTHTGGFNGNTFRDLTNDIEPITEHWKKEGITFDAVYTGYLCSPSQVNAVLSSIDKISNKNTIFIVDPAFADNGKLYSGFDSNFADFMLRLCCKADIITPNITEACFLTNTPLREKTFDNVFVENLIYKLYKITNAKVVLTGISFQDKKIGATIYDGKEISYVFAEKQPMSYHGSGDIFASVLTAAILGDRSLKSAAQIAANFVSLCIKETIKDGTDSRYGLNFEKNIPNLLKYLELE